MSTLLNMGLSADTRMNYYRMCLTNTIIIIILARNFREKNEKYY